MIKKIYFAVLTLGFLVLACSKLDDNLDKAYTPGKVTDGISLKSLSITYSDSGILNQTSVKNAIRAFVTGGGGLVAEEAGSYYSSKNNGTLVQIMTYFSGIITITKPDWQ